MRWLWGILVILLILTRVRVTFYLAFARKLLWAVDIQLGAFNLPEINRQRFEHLQTHHPMKPDIQAVKDFLSALKNAMTARKFLRRHFHLDSLDGTLQLSLVDAAKTALLTGALTGICQIFSRTSQERIRFSVLADFTTGTSTGKVKGIVSFRLGTLWVTMILLLISWRRQRRMTDGHMKEA